MSTHESNDPAPVELADEPARPRWHMFVVIGACTLLLGGLGALISTRDGEPSATEALEEVRNFVHNARTATFEATSTSTTAPKQGELGHTSSSRSRATGKIRLPGDAHAVVDEGDYVQEVISLGSEAFTRDAESRDALATTKWVRWAEGPEADGDSSSPVSAGPDSPEGVAIGAATGVMSALMGGSSVDLEQLLKKLAEPERVDADRIRATVSLRDLLPDEMEEEMKAMRAKFESEQGEADDDVSLEASLPSFDGTVTVTIAYGPEGRLDMLVFDFEQDEEDARSTKRDELRFADWNKPVTIERPGDDAIDATPDLQEEDVALAQTRYGVHALSAPPPDWKLISAYVDERDDESESCEAVTIEYADPAAPEPDGSDDDSEAPAIEIVTVEPNCKWLAENLPDMDDARQVRLGSFTGRLVAEAEDNYYTFLSDGITVVIDIGDVTVVAASNLPEAQFLQVLRSLAPLDLAKQPIGSP